MTNGNQGSRGQTAGPHTGASNPGATGEVHADALHRRALVWDAHADTLHRALVDGYDPGMPSPGLCDLDRWQDGGVRVQVLAIWVDTIFLPDHALRRALQQVDVGYRLIEAYPDRVALARTADDVRTVTAGGRLVLRRAANGWNVARLDELRSTNLRRACAEHPASVRFTKTKT
jgi:hypothetical protein